MKHFLFIILAFCSLSVMGQKQVVPKTQPRNPAKPAAAKAVAKPTATGNSHLKAGAMETLPDGMQLQIFSSGTGKKANPGDLISIHLIIKTGADSTLMSSYSSLGPNKGQPIEVEYAPSRSVADLMEAFGKMGKGDSAVIKIPTDSIFKGEEAAKQRPPFIKLGTFLKYNAKLVEVTDAAARAARETNAIEKFIADMHLNAKKTNSGLYYVITKEGSGEIPKSGDKVKVNYTGRLLNGKLFDTSVEADAKEYAKKDTKYQVRPSYAPFEFLLGQGQVIKGWDEGIGMLKVGTKALLILPSCLGYGAQGAGADIPAYAPLVFDVELLDIVK